MSLADGTQGSDFYESAVPHADVFLADLAAALVPSAVPHHARRYLRNLAEAEAVHISNATACDDPFAICAGETAPRAPPTATNFCCTAGICWITAPPPSLAVDDECAPPAAHPSAGGGTVAAVLLAGVVAGVAALGATLVWRRRARAARMRLLAGQSGSLSSTLCPLPETYAAPTVPDVTPAGSGIAVDNLAVSTAA